MMSVSVPELCEISNQAIIQFEAKSYRDAITRLTNALYAVKTLALNDQPSTKRVIESKSDFLCHFQSSGSTSFLRAVGNGHIYQRSIFGDPIYISIPTSDQEYHGIFEKLSFVVIYNLSLVHHVVAMQGDENTEVRKAHLHKALALYRYSLSLLSKCINFNASFGFSMAIISNMGHIHHVLGDQAEADLNYHRLLSLILLVVDRSDSNETKLLEGFISNVMHLLIKPSVSLAPAA